MSTFLNELKKQNATSLTQNGGKQYSETGSFLLDYFSQMGMMRNKSSEDIQKKFELAYQENSNYAPKAIFYGRDVRHCGNGERYQFRESFLKFAELDQVRAANVLHLIPFFGRWDDVVYIVCNSKMSLIEDAGVHILREQLFSDLNRMYDNEPISLLAKWMPSINASSKTTRKYAQHLYIKMGFKTERDYRKTLSVLRSYIGVLETKISKNEWDNIDYSTVPSLAFKKYGQAFARHSYEQLNEFFSKVEKGEEKINANTLSVIDVITEEIINEWCYNMNTTKDFALENLQWKNLPNYLTSNHNVLVVADSSGSMIGSPMRAAFGLAMYFAERNTGIWKDYMMTFSSKPSLVRLVGNTIQEKLKCIPSIVEDTNFDATMKLVYKTALKSKSDDVPDLVIITDGQFNEMVDNADNTVFEKYKKLFEEAGLKMPSVTFWNVDDTPSYQAFGDVSGVQFASGYSFGIFKQVIEGLGMTAYDAMMKALDNPIYKSI